LIRSTIVGVGHYVPERVVTNAELSTVMDTSDEWIRERTGIEERRWVGGESGADMAQAATEMALSQAGLEASDIDAIVLGTLSPDHQFPGTAVFLQRQLGLQGIPALDIRQQCTGFIYGLNIADMWIRTGQYRTVLLVGVEIQSTGLNLSNDGRDMAVLFGDGAGAAILQGTDDENRGVLSTHMYADGDHAEVLWLEASSSKKNPRITHEDIEEGRIYPSMDGKRVFMHASTRMPEAAMVALEQNGMSTEDIDLLIPHQANLRIAQMVQKKLRLRDEQVYNNIQRYGNTTAASIPIALSEAIAEGRLERGDLLCLVAFGSGFTWGSALIRW
jgi:3-oxoacyl-[acyl-carrier-protein] synthase-3